VSAVTTIPIKAERLLPPLELEVMKVLWEIGEGTVGQVQLELRRLRPFAYTTVMTLLDRLAKKGAVTRRKQGRGYVYAPVMNRDAALNMVIQRILRDFFAGSPTQLIKYLRVLCQEEGLPIETPGPFESSVL
jgi:predicted transcriptional regulator